MRVLADVQEVTACVEATRARHESALAAATAESTALRDQLECLRAELSVTRQELDDARAVSSHVSPVKVVPGGDCSCLPCPKCQHSVPVPTAVEALAQDLAEELKVKQLVEFEVARLALQSELTNVREELSSAEAAKAHAAQQCEALQQETTVLSASLAAQATVVSQLRADVEQSAVVVVNLREDIATLQRQLAELATQHAEELTRVKAGAAQQDVDRLPSVKAKQQLGVVVPPSGTVSRVRSPSPTMKSNRASPAPQSPVALPPSPPPARAMKTSATQTSPRAADVNPAAIVRSAQPSSPTRDTTTVILFDGSPLPPSHVSSPALGKYAPLSPAKKPHIPVTPEISTRHLPGQTPKREARPLALADSAVVQKYAEALHNALQFVESDMSHVRDDAMRT